MTGLETDRNEHAARHGNVDMTSAVITGVVTIVAIALTAIILHEPRNGTRPTPGSVDSIEQGDAAAAMTARPVTWLLWPGGECLHVSGEGSCDDRPAVSRIGWAAPRFDGPPWFEDGKPLGSFDIEFEPQYLQRVRPDGNATR